MSGVLPPGPAAPADPIVDAVHDSAWSRLLARLAPTDDRQSSFEERRYFPFRLTPVVLTGVVRVSPSHGLSLEYLKPDSQIVVMDDQGLLLRDRTGSPHPVPANAHAQAATAALAAVLRFDMPRLTRSFELRGRRTAEAWTLTLVPRDPSLASELGTFTIAGAGSELRQIDLVRAGNQRVEILLGPATPAPFSPETLARYFR
jgi:hypothetical protein